MQSSALRRHLAYRQGLRLHLDIVENRLAGYMAASRQIDPPVAPNVAWRWGRTRPVPPRRWPAILELAERHGVSVTLEELLEGYLPKSVREAAFA